MPLTPEKQIIDWSNPEAALRLLEESGDIPPAEIDGLGEPLDWSHLSERMTCAMCIQTRRNINICCKHHPETGEVDPDTGVCPNLDLESGLCSVYNTPSYPPDCRAYSCPTRKKR